MTENPQMPPSDAVAPSSSALNYIVVAVVFFVLGAVLGSFVFPSNTNVAEPAVASLPDNFDARIQTALESALTETDRFVLSTGDGSESIDTTVAALPSDFDERVQIALEDVLIANGLLPERGLVMGERYEVEEAEEDPYWGNPDATVTVIEFSDFTCGFCGRFARDTMPLLEEEYGDQIKFVYMDFAFLSQMSMPSALAAECADDQGQFWDYHDLLFNTEGGLDNDLLVSYAEELDLDMEAFNTCIDERTHVEEINEDLNYGQELGVSGTPAFFVNGTFVSGAQPIEVFRQIIDSELAAAG